MVGREVYKHLAPLEPEPMTELTRTASILQRHLRELRVR